MSLLQEYMLNAEQNKLGLMSHRIGLTPQVIKA